MSVAKCQDMIEQDKVVISLAPSWLCKTSHSFPQFLALLRPLKVLRDCITR